MWCRASCVVAAPGPPEGIAVGPKRDLDLLPAVAQLEGRDRETARILRADWNTLRRRPRGAGMWTRRWTVSGRAERLGVKSLSAVVA